MKIIKPINVELRVDYAISSDATISLFLDTSDESGFQFSILDIDKDDYSGATTVSFNNVSELKDILSDFESRWDSLKK